MIGAGPTFGVASKLTVLPGLVLDGSASASLLAGYFDLSRHDSYNRLAVTRTRHVDMDTYGVVPMLDASLSLTQRFGNAYLGVGYSLSAALGGAGTISTNGHDDVDTLSSPYRIERNDIINHAVYARVGLTFGSP
jgi:hypothetical protein